MYACAEYTYVCTLLHRRVCRNGHSKNCTSNCAPHSPTLLLWTEHGRPSVSLHDVSDVKSVLLSGMSIHLSVPAQSYCNSSVCVNNVLLPTQPLNTVQGLYLTPDNIEYWATFLHSNATIQDRVIHFGTGTTNEKLLEVPLGQIDPHATIVITVGLDNSHPNTPADSDPVIAITNSRNRNVMSIRDLGNYGSAPPCRPASDTQDGTLVSSGTKVPATFKLTFTPFYKYGSCETAQEGGYINTGRFNTQLDITKPLYLRVYRDQAPEEYYFHYFLVEIY